MLKSIFGLIFALAFTLLGGYSYGQDSDGSTKVAPTYITMRKFVAFNHIKNLNGGILLIRLSTKSNTLAAIRSKGFHNKADQIQYDQEELNKSIASIFSESITFCKTAFFYSEDSPKILSSEFDQVKFMDGELKEISNPLLNDLYFLVLDLAVLQENTPRFDLYRQESTEKGLENKPVYYASSNLHLPAFVLKDQDLVQLMDPFPYYVRTFSLEPSKFRVKLAARKLNKKLMRYYRKVDNYDF